MRLTVDCHGEAGHVVAAGLLEAKREHLLPIALRDAVIYENALAFLAHRTPGPTTAAVFASSRGVSGYRRWPVC